MYFPDDLLPQWKTLSALFSGGSLPLRIRIRFLCLIFCSPSVTQLLLQRRLLRFPPPGVGGPSRSPRGCGGRGEGHAQGDDNSRFPATSELHVPLRALLGWRCTIRHAASRCFSLFLYLLLFAW